MKTLTVFQGSIAALAFALSVPFFSITHAADSTSASIRLDWRPGAQHSPFFLARERGYYRDEGLELEIISGSGSSDTIQQVGSGRVELGVADAFVLSQGAEQRVPVTSIAAYYQRSPVVVMSPQNAPVTSPEQLPGVKLGHNRGSATSQGLTALVAANDMALTDLNLIPVGFGVQPLLAGQVEAMMGFAMGQPVEAEEAGMPIQTMPISEHGVDNYGLMLVANSNFLEDHPELVQGFVSATLRGINDAVTDPEAAVAALMAAVDERDAARELKVLAATIPYWLGENGDVSVIGHQELTRWEQTIAIAKELGLVEAAPDAAGIFTTQFVQD
ncbi:ABC transporter substrate-binding protein [Vreelandella olivaria]|uniref:ABC transporter substrate-binding protein n=1 Tax=Vreelandella olivaria TaxID=390919 RepID=UPI00201E9367|nr:ABC transporter substrate-binding protein [Halomonas olivaria]